MVPIADFAQAFRPALRNSVLDAPSNQDISDAMSRITQAVNYRPKFNAVNDPLVRIAQAIKDSPSESADVAVRETDIKNLQDRFGALRIVGLSLMQSPPQGSDLWYAEDLGRFNIMGNVQNITSIKEAAEMLIQCHDNMAELRLFGSTSEVEGLQQHCAL